MPVIQETAKFTEFFIQKDLTSTRVQAPEMHSTMTLLTNISTYLTTHFSLMMHESTLDLVSLATVCALYLDKLILSRPLDKAGVACVSIPLQAIRGKR